MKVLGPKGHTYTGFLHLVSSRLCMWSLQLVYKQDVESSYESYVLCFPRVW